MIKCICPFCGEVYAELNVNIRLLSGTLKCQCNCGAVFCKSNHNADSLELVNELHNDGMQVDDIAGQVNISRERVRALLEKQERINADKERKQAEYDEIRAAGDIHIDELNFSPRVNNCLKYAGINTLNSLLEYAKTNDISAIRNLGMRGAEEIKQKIKENTK